MIKKIFLCTFLVLLSSAFGRCSSDGSPPPVTLKGEEYYGRYHESTKVDSLEKQYEIDEQDDIEDEEGNQNDVKKAQPKPVKSNQDTGDREISDLINSID